MADRSELRHRLISALLQAGEPLTGRELAAQCEGAEEALDALLLELVAEGLVVQGWWEAQATGLRYRWAARWREELARRTAQAKRELTARLAAAGPVVADVFGEGARIFSDYIADEYRPPADKRFLVFFQCCVRRPFSTSPSHASMRRAIALATGRDPAHDFAACPVHVVVLASEVGPVPYELEEVPPASISAGGVKHFSEERYRRAGGVLAERLARYLRAHRDCYDRVATFTGGRYGEVMQEVRRLSQWDFPVLPDPTGPEVLRLGRSRPRTYWQQYWIQLYREIVRWLPEAAQARAAARLAAAQVEWRE